MTNKPQTTYALFENGKQISKSHASRLVCMMEAYERGIVVRGHKDFGDEPDSVNDEVLANGYEIKEMKI
jgi:hypothetical protein